VVDFIVVAVINILFVVVVVDVVLFVVLREFGETKT